MLSGTVSPISMLRRQLRTRVLAAALACALAPALAPALACGARPREPLTVGVQRQPAAGLMLFALQQGYFRHEGLDVTAHEFASGRDGFRAMMDGRIDVAIVYSTPVLLQAFEGPSPRILTVMHRSGKNTALVARADRGIRTPHDLRGKTVGAPRDTNAEFFLRTLLEFGGVGWNEVRVVDVRPQDVPDALAEGRIDAAAVWTPIFDRAERALGPGGSVTLRSDVYSDVSMLVTRSEVVASRRGALKSALRALVRAERVASADPEQLFGAMRAALPELQPDELRAQLGRVQLRLGASHLLVQNLRSEAEWFTRAGRVPRSTLDLRSLVVTDLLDEVEPELVTLEGYP